MLKEIFGEHFGRFLHAQLHLKAQIPPPDIHPYNVTLPPITWKLKTTTKVFEIVTLVDTGGSSMVYEEGEEYAAKTNFTDSKENVNELNTMRLLSTSGEPHPNLPTLCDHTQAAIFMRPLGNSLHKYLEPFTDPTRPLTVILGILAARYHIHQKGLVHNDVRPDNIITS
ncbi:hypothetical protein HK097_004515 [Rhizophlyctis rosea]|uniref:Protein kinase domain-containing protein n=1 Tax=Rhizophlyctis rosea TaxID=64517 RepID=A0AAD5S1H6_9FUNG|nr:hypothetical protein HK097_004515 [Rhizophlyctis rosea]